MDKRKNGDLLKRDLRDLNEENKLIKKQLELIEDNFSIALDNSSIIIAHCDCDLRYTWIYNPHPDFSPRESIGKRDDELTKNQGTLELMKLKRKVIEEGKLCRKEITFPLSNGQLTYDVAAAPLKNDKGNIIGCTTASSDISHIKKIQKQLLNDKIIRIQRLEDEINFKKKQLKEIEEYDKMQTEFFATISHELKTPLNIILGCVQLMELANNDSKELKDRVKKMKQNCYRLLRLINNLIDITRLDAGFYKMDYDNYNIVGIIEGIVMSVVDFAKNKGIKIVFDTQIEEKVLACDALKIERVILNLLSNAVKFTDFGGAINVNIYDEQDSILISIKDTGIGIKEEELDEIFDRFKQAESLFTRVQEGSGIGLSLVKSIIENHGGNISVKSKYGEGSEFIIKLPIKKIDFKEIKAYKAYDEIASATASNVERIHIEFSDIYE